MLTCDWCGEPIREADYGVLEPGGCYKGGNRIRLAARIYHTSYEYETSAAGHGLAPTCCFAQVLRLVNDDGAFQTPDAGMEWKLVPCGETAAAWRRGYASPALGTTPLADLGLTDSVYRKVTRHGVFTVEHAADARARGTDLSLGAKQLGQLDAKLLERGLVPTSDRRA